MGQFEEVISSNAKQVPTISHCIDDIFLVWTGTRIELNKLMLDINVHPSIKIKFDYQSSELEVSFLDTNT